MLSLRLTLASAALIAPLASVPAGARDAINYAAAIPVWQAHEARLLAIGWRLARRNAVLCANSPRAIGVMLADARRYDDPDRARAALGIGGDVVIEAVAVDSPAYSAGLRAGTELLAIGGEPVAGLVDPRAKGDATSDALYDRIDSQLARGGKVTLRIASGGQSARDITVSGEPACRARFSLARQGTAAQTKGVTIEVAVQLLAEARSDDEAATMVAHELAHNIFGHWQRNLAIGRNNYVVIRRSEREADRLAPWLMANAGYNPAAAPRFFAGWGQLHGGGITRSPTHDGWQDRVAAVTAELPAITAAQASSGEKLADWRTRFPGQLAE